MPRPFVLVLSCLLFAAACSKRKDYSRPLPPGAVAIEELPVSEWPEFSLAQTDRAGLLAGIEHSLDYLDAPSSQEHFPLAGVTHDAVRRGLGRFRELLGEGLTDRALNAALRREFRVFRSRGWDGSGEVLFTGYYTPIFAASRRPTAEFRHPVYELPDDLIKGATNKEVAQQKLPDGSTRPYPTYAELVDSGKLRDLELVYFEDEFDAYIVNVQGSAKLRLRDGSLLEIGYAGSNGHEYHAIAHDLVADGHLRTDQINLQAMRDFFRERPDLVRTYTRRNPRLTFFHEAPGGPFGSLGRPVTPDVTLAADKRIFPRAALTYVDTSAPDRRNRVRPYTAFRLDQDDGGAIKAPGRADLYMGEGDEAERRAGYQMAEGFLYYLIRR